MTPEERSLLERTYKLSEENNEILRSIRRSNRWSMALRIAYWAVILILSFGAYYLIQPYLTAITGGSVGGIQGLENDVNNAQNAANGLKDLLK